MSHRPKYESDKDLQAEKMVAKYLKSKHQIDCFKLPISYRLDWIVFKNRKLLGFMELKTRTVKHNEYPSLILSLSKYSYGCQLAHLTGSTFWVAAKWTDGLGFCKCDDIAIGVEMWGRHDRGDKDDFEPVVHLPIELFERTP